MHRGIETTASVVMDEPILTAVALTLATKTAEEVAEGGRAVFAALGQLIRRRFEGHSSGTVALVEAEAHPTDSERIQALRNELALATAGDSEFEAQLRSLWQALSPYLAAGADGVVNNVSGSVNGNVVQARDVHGGISFGNPAPPPS